MTQHHENEDTSSSLYTQNNPWQPTVNFENFVRNNESLENQVSFEVGCRVGWWDRGRNCGAPGRQADLTLGQECSSVWVGGRWG